MNVSLVWVRRHDKRNNIIVAVFKCRKFFLSLTLNPYQTVKELKFCCMEALGAIMKRLILYCQLPSVILRKLNLLLFPFLIKITFFHHF